ncbi:MAG: hypothetical protein DI547_05055 [Sphingobium sp.]|nr:MAG: hypothetical protein DI547_05055 [Sphingobium sp.]
MAALPFACIPLPLGTIATGNETAAKLALHLGEFAYIGMTWRSAGNANLWIRGDFGSARDVDFVSLLSANALPGTTIRVRLGDTQAAVDGTAAYDSGALSFISPGITREDGLYHSHLELPSLQTRRWWRIDIGGHTGDFEAAKLVLGKKVVPSRYYSAGFEFGVEDLGEISLNRWGVPDESQGLIFRTLRFTLGWITEAEYETSWRPLAEKLGKRRVAHWCFDPAATTYRQARTYFGWLSDAPYATGGVNKPGTFSQDFVVNSMI